MTNAEPAAVAGLFESLRPYGDEIVIAVDDRVEPELLSPLTDVADRVIRFPFEAPVERPLGWLHAQCRGDWILRIDSDEVPSVDLLRALPGLTTAGDVTHYWLPRRWLFPSVDQFLDQAPWRPDYQPRLVRNIPALLRFPGMMHSTLDPVGPGRYLALPLYHRECVDCDFRARTEKIREYESMRPGLRAVGMPMNAAYYLPELRESPCLARVPAPDLELITRIASVEFEDAALGGSPAVEHATRDRIDRYWERRHIAESAYRARIVVSPGPHVIVAGEQGSMDVAVENLGDETWPWDGGRRYPQIRLGYRIFDQGGRVIVAEGVRTSFPADVPPRGRTIVPAQIVGPRAPGEYTVEFDLVHELVRWFGCAARSTFNVVETMVTDEGA